MLDMWDYMLGPVALFALMMFVTRLDISIIQCDIKNLSARKKINKGQSFKEWLLLSRWKHLLPKRAIVSYYIILFLFPLLTLTFLIMGILGTGTELAKNILEAVYWPSLVYMLIILMYRKIDDMFIKNDKKYSKGSKWIFIIAVIALLLLPFIEVFYELSK